jgi:hypothetical protein
VQLRRSTLGVFAVCLVAGALLPAGATALIAPPTPGAGSSQPAARSVFLREHVSTAGLFDIEVRVASNASAVDVVDVTIGSLARPTTVSPGRRVLVRVRLPIRGRSLTIRAVGNLATPTIRASIQRVQSPTAPRTRSASGTTTPKTSVGSTGSVGAAGFDTPLVLGLSVTSLGSGSAGATGSAGGTGSSRSSRSIAATGSIGSTGRSGSTAPSGSTGRSGSTGQSGSTGPSGPSGSTGSSGPSGPSGSPGSAGSAGSSLPSSAPVIVLPGNFAPVATYAHLVRDYEFTGSSLPSDWASGANSTHGYQATIYQPSQVALNGSSVSLTAARQSSGGYAYQSGWISTEGRYAITHGLIDFRAKMPDGQGLWSGLWLDQPDGSNPWGEIDVQEMLLANTHTVYGSLHGWAPGVWGETQTTRIASDASTGFHDYQLVWQPGLLTWAVDGVAYAQYTQEQAIAAGYPWVQDDGSGYYLIANLAVAAPSEWGGAPNASTVFPATMALQSVKVWQ